MSEIKIPVALEPYLRELARVAGKEAAEVVIRQHLSNCQVRQDFPRLKVQVERNRVSVARLAGLMAGTGLLAAVGGRFLANVVGW